MVIKLTMNEVCIHALHSSLVRVGFKVAQFLLVLGVVEFHETVSTEEGGALRSQFVFLCHPFDRLTVAQRTETCLYLVLVYEKRIVGLL